MMTRFSSIFLLSFAMLFAATATHAQRVQQVFKTPQAAMAAFGAAVKADDDASFQLLLGEDYKDFIPVPSKQDYQRFIAAWDKAHAIVLDTPSFAHISVGDKGWTLPLPLIKQGEDWRFDMEQATQEMKQRTIGANEIAVIQAMLAYGDAQREYAQIDRMGDGVLQYAQRLQSTPGTKDGLYWPTNANEPRSPIGEYFAETRSVDGMAERGFHGYFFRILTAQGPAAAGGSLNYIAKGRMIGGYALIAWPVVYGETGVMSFMINQAGEVYQKNLGPQTESVQKNVLIFNPEASWQKVSKDDL